MTSGSPRVVRVTGSLLPEFSALRDEASAEGYRHMDRLAAEWEAGRNRFEQDGEALLAAYVGNVLVGVGGVTRDPNVPGSLRMRRFYVRPAFRRQGVGESMAVVLIASAPASICCFTVNAGDADAGAFWEALGFARDGGAETHTHVLAAGPVLS